MIDFKGLFLHMTGQPRNQTLACRGSGSKTNERQCVNCPNQVHTNSNSNCWAINRTQQQELGSTMQSISHIQLFMWSLYQQLHSRHCSYTLASMELQVTYIPYSCIVHICLYLHWKEMSAKQQNATNSEVHFVCALLLSTLARASE